MHKMPIAALRLVAAAALLTSLGAAQAVTVLSNLPGTAAAVGTNLGLGIDGGDRTKGVGFTVGTQPLRFDSLQALVSNAAAAPNSVLSGGIFSNVGGNPGVLLVPFVPVAIPSGFATAPVTLSSLTPFTMSTGVSYWFVLDGPETEQSLVWLSLTSNAAPTAPGGAVSYLGYRFSSTGGATWASSSVFNGVAINASVVPEPATTLLLLGGLGGLLAWRSRRG